jgi:CRISPR-associated protein Cpf1
MNTFEKVTGSTIADDFSDILKDLSSFINLNSIEVAFSIDYFNETLTQTGIDRYNLLLGGYTSDDNKTKIKGLNEFINLFNQQQTDKTKKIGRLKPLFKQILSDRNAASYLPEAFESDNEVLESIEKSYHDILESALSIKKIVDDVNSDFQHEEFDQAMNELNTNDDIDDDFNIEPFL